MNSGRRTQRLLAAAASSLAALVATFVGSEMLEAVPQARNERTLLAAMTLAVFFGLWAEWEMLQVRQHLRLTKELGSGS